MGLIFDRCLSGSCKSCEKILARFHLAERAANFEKQVVPRAQRFDIPSRPPAVLHVAPRFEIWVVPLDVSLVVPQVVPLSLPVSTLLVKGSKFQVALHLVPWVVPSVGPGFAMPGHGSFRSDFLWLQDSKSSPGRPPPPVASVFNVPPGRPPHSPLTRFAPWFVFPGRLLFRQPGRPPSLPSSPRLSFAGVHGSYFGPSGESSYQYKHSQDTQLSFSARMVQMRKQSSRNLMWSYAPTNPGNKGAKPLCCGSLRTPTFLYVAPPRALRAVMARFAIRSRYVLNLFGVGFHPVLDGLLRISRQYLAR